MQRNAQLFSARLHVKEFVHHSKEGLPLSPTKHLEETKISLLPHDYNGSRYETAHHLHEVHIQKTTPVTKVSTNYPERYIEPEYLVDKFLPKDDASKYHVLPKPLHFDESLRGMHMAPLHLRLPCPCRNCYLESITNLYRLHEISVKNLEDFPVHCMRGSSKESASRRYLSPFPYEPDFNNVRDRISNNVNDGDSRIKVEDDENDDRVTHGVRLDNKESTTTITSKQKEEFHEKTD